MGTAAAATQSTRFTYDAPVVSRLSSRNGVGTGTSSITLEGTSFGMSGLTPTMALGPTSCITASWTSDSMVRCSGPAAYDEGGNNVGTRQGPYGVALTIQSVIGYTYGLYSYCLCSYDLYSYGLYRCGCHYPIRDIGHGYICHEYIGHNYIGHN